MGGVAALVAAAVLAAAPSSYVESRQQADGGFAEPGGRSTPGLTAWAVVGLQSAGRSTKGAVDYLRAHERELLTATDVELAVIAEAVGTDDGPSEALRARFAGLSRSGGRIGPTINSTAWGVLAHAQIARSTRVNVSYLLRQQHRSGGWGWVVGTAPDSNDTAAVIQALRSQGVRGRPITRGLAYLRGLQNRDGGFELSPGRGSDAQSTAWAVQAFIAAGTKAPVGAFRYLAGLKRADGSYRYSRRYGSTPVWVTSQVLPAINRRPFPLR